MTRFALNWVVPAVTIGAIIAFALASPHFLSASNAMNVLTQVCPSAIATCAVFLLATTRHLDLSVGSNVALCVSVMAWVGAQSPPLGIAAGLLVGTVVGVTNGLLVEAFRLPSLVVTLGTMVSLRAVATSLDQLVPANSSTLQLFRATDSGVAIALSIVGVVIATTATSFHSTPLGRELVAIGVDRDAAFTAGVKTSRRIVWLYAVVGGAAALAALATVARLGASSGSTIAQGLELTVLAAVLLGGVPITGGRGSLSRALLAVLLIGVVRNGLTLLNVDNHAANLTAGAALALASVVQLADPRVRQAWQRPRQSSRTDQWH